MHVLYVYFIAFKCFNSLFAKPCLHCSYKLWRTLAHAHYVQVYTVHDPQALYYNDNYVMPEPLEFKTTLEDFKQKPPKQVVWCVCVCVVGFGRGGCEVSTLRVAIHTFVEFSCPKIID